MPVAILPTPRGASAFAYLDPEGAPDWQGIRRHGALDWFAAGGTPVSSPCDGTAVEVKPSRGTSGQIYGGVVKIRDVVTGRVYVMRHIEPACAYGERVDAGEQVARVTRWADNPGASHCHLEVWRTLGGGYRIANMIDPATLTWTTAPPAPELPPGDSSLRLVIGDRRWSGWRQATGAILWVTRHGIASAIPCAISWRGQVWRGSRAVEGVCANLARRFLTPTRR